MRGTRLAVENTPGTDGVRRDIRANVRKLLLSALAVLGAAAGSAAQDPSLEQGDWSLVNQDSLPLPPRDSLIEQGRFHLFWVQQHAGTETYEIRLKEDTLTLESNFEYVDRDTPVPLRTTLRMQEDLSPVSLRMFGKTARSHQIDLAVEVMRRFARITEGQDTRTSFVPGRYFAIAGYAPAAVQMMLLRYWRRHGKPGSLHVLPKGTVSVEERGRDTVAFSGSRIVLERYSVGGIIWGTETLWTDARGKLIAAVTIDGEGEPFEIVRDGFQDLLPYFVARGVEDGMARILEMGRIRSHAPDARFALVGARIIDGSGLSPIEEGTIVFRGDTIEAVGLTPLIDIPPGTRVINVRGKTIVPGLWDMHAHFQQVEWGPAYLAAGVTTVRDMANGFEFVSSVREVLNRGQGIGPRMFLAGLILGPEVRTPEEAFSLVRRYRNAAFDQIKIYSFVRPDLVPAIAREAHGLDMTITGHVPDGMDVLQAVVAGMDQISHLSYIQAAMLPPDVRDLPDDRRPVVDTASFDARFAVDFLRDHATVVDPTLAVSEFYARYGSEPIDEFEPAISKVAPALQRQLRAAGAPRDTAARRRMQFENQLAILKTLHDAGVPIVAGTDMLVPGHSLHRELELYVQAGLTPMEALMSATKVPAQVMRVVARSGTLAPGKQADMVILDANPLDDIRNIRRIDRVIARGRFYEPDDLWRRIDFEP